jgi:hypothetical protein
MRNAKSTSTGPMGFGEAARWMPPRTAMRAEPDPASQIRRAPRANAALGAITVVHTLAWFSIESCMAYLLYSGFTGRSDRRVAIAASVVATESLVFAVNGFRCPLTTLAERLGAEHGSVTDLYLPKWIARNLPAIHVPLMVLAGFLHARTIASEAKRRNDLCSSAASAGRCDETGEVIILRRDSGAWRSGYTHASGGGRRQTQAAPTIRILLGLLIFLGVTALAGGIEMLLFPTGNEFLPRQWLDDIPVIDSWLLPGLVLGGGFGVGSLLTAYALRRRWAWWWPGTILLGVGMIVWIGLEVLFLPQRSLLEAIYGTVGVLLVALPVTASARRHRSQAHVTAGLG